MQWSRFTVSTHVQGIRLFLIHPETALHFCSADKRRHSAGSYLLFAVMKSSVCSEDLVVLVIRRLEGIVCCLPAHSPCKAFLLIANFSAIFCCFEFWLNCQGAVWRNSAVEWILLNSARSRVINISIIIPGICSLSKTWITTSGFLGFIKPPIIYCVLNTHTTCTHMNLSGIVDLRWPWAELCLRTL